MKDPIVDEVRRHRQAHARRFDLDLAMICRDLAEIQRLSKHQVVRLEAVRVKPLSAVRR